MSKAKAKHEQDMSDIARALAALQPTGRPLSKAARFRQQLPDIEEALARDIPQADVVATLAQHGVDMTLDEFRNALYRARKRKKAEETRHAPAPPPPPAPPKAPAPATQQTTPNQTKPAERFDWQNLRDQGNSHEW